MWRAARSGAAPLVIGTRSAIFVPLARPGIIIVDEEHDSSYKQQDGFRYSARDLAVVRAQRHGIPVVLGSATPSLETLQQARSGRYRRVDLPERTGSAGVPTHARRRPACARGPPWHRDAERARDPRATWPTAARCCSTSTGAASRRRCSARAAAGRRRAATATRA